jgi:uncharacterized protein YbaR (Trm112 family)
MSAHTLTAEELRWVACPVCHHPLELLVDAVQCTGCSRRYPIVDGIPVLLANRTI